MATIKMLVKINGEDRLVTIIKGHSFSRALAFTVEQMLERGGDRDRVWGKSDVGEIYALGDEEVKKRPLVTFMAPKNQSWERDDGEE